MIYQVSGDILLTQAQMIAHGIAPNDPMNQGLALSLHEQYPSMHKDFHHWMDVGQFRWPACRQPDNTRGWVRTWSTAWKGHSEVCSG